MAAPLASCIMPTSGRPQFAEQAAQYFLRQDYPERELLILDDGRDDISSLLPDDSRIRYFRLPRLSIGAKRNLGCRLARGEIIAQWDDDDWHGPGRLSAQFRPLIEGRAEVTGIRGSLMFDLASWQAWACSPSLHRSMYRHDVHGGTLVFCRWCWERLACYPDRSLAEDARFLSGLVRAWCGPARGSSGSRIGTCSSISGIGPTPGRSAAAGSGSGAAGG